MKLSHPFSKMHELPFFFGRAYPARCRLADRQQDLEFANFQLQWDEKNL
jgi:hypothetical protein